MRTDNRKKLLKVQATPSYQRNPFQDKKDNIEYGGIGGNGKTPEHSRNPSKTQIATTSFNLNLAFSKISEISKRIELLKSKPIFYFTKKKGYTTGEKESITVEKNPGLANLCYEIEFNTNNNYKVTKISQKNAQGEYQNLDNCSPKYSEEKTLLENYLNSHKNKKEIAGEFNQNNNANNSSAIEDAEIKSILSKIQNHVNQAFEKNEIKTQGDLSFYKELIKKIEVLLKSPVDKSNDKNTTKTTKLHKNSSRSDLKDDNKIISFTENNNKFCKFLEDNNIGNSNVEALQPYNISNKPFIIRGKTFFLSKQQIKYLADIKSLLLTENRPELTREPVIINGVPGSGKSHLTKLITEEKENLESLLKQIDERAIGQLKYEAKELNYCEFYNYQEGQVSNKLDKEIETIIDRKISVEDSKLFLMVDEWGVMYPPYATEYLKTKQQTNENIIIIGISANPEPIKALLDSAHKTLSNGTNYKNHNIINSKIFDDKSRDYSSNRITYNHIVDFTTEINSSDALQNYIKRNDSIISDNSYVICNYKNQENQNNYFFICQKNGDAINKISTSINQGNTVENAFAFNQEGLLNLIKNSLIKNNLNQNNFNLIASHSTARGADFNAIINNINIAKKVNLSSTEHNYKIIDNAISKAGSSVDAMANIAQGLQRARLLKTENLQPNGNFPNNHHIEIYSRALNHKVEEYNNMALKEVAIKNNNFFKLAEINNHEYKNLSQEISSQDLAILKSEIQKCENIEKYQNIKNTVDFINFLKENSSNGFDYEKSLNELINSNKEEKEFNKYHCLARASLFLQSRPNKYNLPSLQESEATKIKEFFIKDFIDKANYTIVAKNIDTDNVATELNSKKQGFLEFQVTNGQTLTQHEKYSLSKPINIGYNQSNPMQEEEAPLLTLRNIAYATGFVGGLAACFYYWSSSNSATPPVHPTPQINPFIKADINTIKADISSHLKINNYGGDYNIKNIAFNSHHQHSTSLIGKSNILHLGGATKTAHLSIATGTASKLGLATKAGILASAFTPLLAIAGIATAGYLGYKAFEYFYTNEEKENLVQNNKKNLDKLNLHQDNVKPFNTTNEYKKIFTESEKKPSILITPNNISKAFNSALQI